MKKRIDENGIPITEDDKVTPKKCKWVISSDGYYSYCPKCYYIPLEMTRYCPNCGEKMMEESNES